MRPEDPKFPAEETANGPERARDLYELAKHTMGVEITADEPVKEDTRF